MLTPASQAVKDILPLRLYAHACFAREDIIFIEEVIGAGEIAISDQRAAPPDVRELARLVTDAHVGGMLSRKCGVTHFHVGDGEKRLEPIRSLLRDTEVQPEWLYLTHVERNEPLMKEAVEIASKGVFVDVDIVEARGQRLVAQGRLNVEEPFLKQSTRRVSLHGKKHEQ